VKKNMIICMWRGRLCIDMAIRQGSCIDMAERQCTELYVAGGMV